MRRSHTTPGSLRIVTSQIDKDNENVELSQILAEMPPDALLGSLSPRRGCSVRNPAGMLPDGWPEPPSLLPLRPPRPATLVLDDSYIEEDENSPAVPDYLFRSGIAYPEQLPVWVRTMDGRGSVVDLAGQARGGLRMHPVTRDKL
jgi:hypothetical protein